MAFQLLRAGEQQADNFRASRFSDLVAVTGVGNARQNADHSDDNQQFDQAQSFLRPHVPAP
ncbi:hypothetical protein D3C75_1007390 [compost metagenome]